ncbi:MAG: hypothetical protein ACRBCK_02245 [Alphaproteobacteria bacterium]
MTIKRKITIGVVAFFIYLLSTIPVGLFLYSLKTESGLNVFSKTGFHSYVYCLQEQVEAIGSQK